MRVLKTSVIIFVMFLLVGFLMDTTNKVDRLKARVATLEAEKASISWVNDIHTGTSNVVGYLSACIAKGLCPTVEQLQAKQ